MQYITLSVLKVRSAKYMNPGHGQCMYKVCILGSSLSYHPETCTIYLFGGWKEGQFDADIYRVRVDPDVDEWHWERVVMKPGAMKPSGRYS